MSRQIKLDVFSTAEKNMRVKERGPYELPVGWKWVEIEEIVTEFQSGFACSKKYATEIGIPHLRPNNIGFYGELDLSRLVFFPAELVNLDKYSLKKGDVLFNNTNSKELVGRACLVKENLDYAFSNHITRLRVNKQLITPEWLVLSINYLWLKGYFLSICRKWIGQAGVNTTMLKSIKIPLPPLDEQKRIVAHLEELVSRAEEAERLRRIAREEAERIMQAALHKVFSNATEKGWKWVKIRKVAKTTSGGTPSRSKREYFGGDIPWVKSGELEDNVVYDTEEKITKEGLESSNAKIFPRGTLLVAMYGATVGKTGILKIDAATNQAVCAIFPKEEMVLRDYIRYYFIFKRNELLDRSFGGAQPNISQTFIKNLSLPLPSLEEQERIVAYLNKIAENVQSLKKLQQKTEEELEKLVPAILDRAFKGEL